MKSTWTLDKARDTPIIIRLHSTIQFLGPVEQEQPSRLSKEKPKRDYSTVYIMAFHCDNGRSYLFESAACIQHLGEDPSGRCTLRLQSGVVWLCLLHCRTRVVCFEALTDGKISFVLL